MKTFFTFLLVGALSIATLNAQNQGQVAPDFTLQEYNGGTFKLSDQQGKVVFVFLLGYNCSLCRAASPTVKSTIIEAYKNNPNVVMIGIDTWDGNDAGVQSFLNATGIGIPILKNGSSVANSWSTTYDRLIVIDSDGIMSHKQNSNASSDANNAKAAIETALNKVATSVTIFNENKVFSLEQNFPNPVKNSTTIRFNLHEAATISLKVYDITGKVVRAHMNSINSPGSHSFKIKREDLDNGIYFYKMEANGRVETRKMVLN